MNFNFISIIPILTLSIAFSSVAFGSGGSTGGSYSSGSRTVTKVDQTYEIGKSIFNGRQSGIAELDYCVKVEGESLEVKTRSLKSFKKETYSALANNLVNCNEPDTLISEELDSDSLLYVIYYLNSRYKLNLKQS